MQTLEPRAVTVPNGYFVFDCYLTKAGEQKFENWFYDNKDPNWHVNAYSAAADMLSDAINMESHPFYVLGAMFSCDGEFHKIDLIENIDYVFEFKSFEAHRLERLAYELNELHNTMQQEMARLGW